MAIEIVSFPINSMVIFNSYVSHYQRVFGDFPTDVWHLQKDWWTAKRLVMRNATSMFWLESKMNIFLTMTQRG